MALNLSALTGKKVNLSSLGERFPLSKRAAEEPGLATRLGERLEERRGTFEETTEAVSRLPTPQTFQDRLEQAGILGRQLTGQAFGVASDIFGELITSAFRALPDALEEDVRVGARNAVENIAKSPIGQQVVQKATQTIEDFQAFKEKNPIAASEITALGLVAGGIFDFASFGGKTALTKLSKLGLKQSDEIISVLKKAKVPEASITDDLVKTIAKTTDTKEIDRLLTNTLKKVSKAEAPEVQRARLAEPEITTKKKIAATKGNSEMRTQQVELALKNVPEKDLEGISGIRLFDTKAGEGRNRAFARVAREEGVRIPEEFANADPFAQSMHGVFTTKGKILVGVSSNMDRMIVHEVGHNVYRGLPPKEKAKILVDFNNRKDFNKVSSHGKTDVQEYFADLYANRFAIKEEETLGVSTPADAPSGKTRTQLQEAQRDLRQREQQPLKTPLQSQSDIDNRISSSLAESIAEQGHDVKGRSFEELRELAGTPKTITLKDGTKVVDSDDIYELTTREIKQTSDYKSWRDYAIDKYQDRDINPSITQLGHVSFTAERLAEFMDDAVGGRMWREVVKPVFDGAERTARELDEVSARVRNFRVVEGSKIDRDAFLFAEGKIKDADPRAKDIAKFVRGQYDELLERMNAERKKIGVEPIPKRADYVTHLNELSVLSDMLGGDRISVNNRIRKLKKFYIEEKGFDEGRAWEAAKRDVDGATGVMKYVDSKHPRFDFIKKRLEDYQRDPSIIRSFRAYLPQAVRYIHQAENVAKVKAWKDVLPPNAKEFMRKWNTEQVAGRPNTGWLSPQAKLILSPLRGTLGANTILGNAATMMMQLTSFPQVFATAGLRNTFYGISKRLSSYLTGNNNFNQSQVKALRDLGIDMGLGDSLLDEFLRNVGRMETLKTPAAQSRQAIQFGRFMLRSLMEKFDQFTVGATYEAFYRKGINEGLSLEDAVNYSNIMTGKTQANYFKEALPPFLNSFEGRTIGQFGTYSMNQWEFFKRDFGKVLKLNEKSERSVRDFSRQFITFLTAAYIVDSLSDKTFGRQPYEIKQLADEMKELYEGNSDSKEVLDSAKDTAFSYIPFLGSVKFGSMPPVLDFGFDAFNALLGEGAKKDRARKEIQEKWAFSVLLPYGGNQVRKTFQGIETTEDVDLPLVRDVSEGKFEVHDDIDRVRSWLFGGYASNEAKDFFENRDKREFIKRKYELEGTITSDENIARLKRMTPEEFDIYTKGYADSTLKTINRKIGEAQRPSLEAIFGGQSLEDIFR